MRENFDYQDTVERPIDFPIGGGRLDSRHRHDLPFDARV